MLRVHVHDNRTTANITGAFTRKHQQQLILRMPLHDKQQQQPLLHVRQQQPTANVTGASTSSTANVRQQQRRVDL